MSDLRETVERHVQWAINMPKDAYDGYLAYDATDRILAAVAEALTSKDVVRKARHAYYQSDSHASDDNVRDAITAALRAVGIVKGEGDDSR